MGILPAWLAGRQYYQPQQPLVVVCCFVTFASVQRVVSELFNEVHDQRLLRLVVLSPWEPGRKTSHLMQDPKFAARITWLVGDPVREEDLQRAAVKDASAVFIFTSQGLGSIEEIQKRDSVTLMSASKL